MESTSNAVVVSTFHRDFCKAIDAGVRATNKMRDTVIQLVKGRYAETMPVYGEYDADQQAFALLAKERKLADNQYYRKLYAGVITELYGALPVSLADDAAKKRTQRLKAAPAYQQAAYHAAIAENKDKPEHVREALALHAVKQAKKPAGQPTAGAPKDTPKPQAPSPAESLEQLVARYGLPETLELVAKILASEKATQIKAKTLCAIAAELRQARAKKAA